MHFTTLHIATSIIQKTYHAIFAIRHSGYLLTQYFLTSSVKSIHKPNATGKKYSTGILDELMAVVRPGIYKNMKITINANRIARNNHKFWVFLLKIGGCWKIESLLVLVAYNLLADG